MTCCALIDVLFPDDRRRNVDCLASQDRHQAVSISKYLRVFQSPSEYFRAFGSLSRCFWVSRNDNLEGNHLHYMMVMMVAMMVVEMRMMVDVSPLVRSGGAVGRNQTIDL